MPTRTGPFKIGFRQGWTSWQRDVPGLAAWAGKVGFEALDLSAGMTASDLAALASNHLAIGTVDLMDFGGLMTPDPAKRTALVERNLSHIKSTAAVGANTFFTCMLPGDPSAKRAENYKLAVETFTPLCAAAAEAGGTIVLEGYPGGGPHYSAIGCTPESIRQLLRDIPIGLSLNFDPSHLVRLGVDPVRFLKEFAPHVRHCHAKDTELFAEAVYEYGLYQSPTFGTSHGFGEAVWRYTIPGHGVVPWTSCFAILQEAGYHGAVCVELEDEHFNGTEAGEKEGLRHALNYLQSA
jgi:sugar phosphate isomerase/epimerase